MQILVATTNANKLRELKQMLKAFPQLDLLSLQQFPDYEPPEETGETLEEIACLKAQHAADALNHLVLADDSGLFVPSLQGAPGIFTARYAGKGASSRENCRKLLDEMKPFEGEERAACFQCALALAKPGELLKCVTGRCEGWIAHEERGGDGFGYEPLFIKDSYDKTFAELASHIKNQVSHRSKAVCKMMLFLERLCGT